MRPIFFLPLILLGACAANLPHPQEDRVALRVAFADLALDRPAGRAALNARVASAVAEFCRAYSDEVTPQLIRTETGYCLDTMRQSILAEMPRDVRKAYARAQAEVR